MRNCEHEILQVTDLLQNIQALRTPPKLSRDVVLKETWTQQCGATSAAAKIVSAVTSKYYWLSAECIGYSSSS
jgi:hypothetical protein